MYTQCYIFLQVGTNGVFSFNREFRQDSPEAFPSTDLAVQYEYLVTPFWSNVDTRLSGQVRYIIQSVGETSVAIDSSDFQPVVSFINSEQDPEFTNAKWMLVAMWDQVHPFPHGESASVERQDPYLKSVSIYCVGAFGFIELRYLYACCCIVLVMCIISLQSCVCGFDM